DRFDVHGWSIQQNTAYYKRKTPIYMATHWTEQNVILPKYQSLDQGWKREAPPSPERQGAALPKAWRRSGAGETIRPSPSREGAPHEEVRALKPSRFTAVAYSQEKRRVMGCRGPTAPANLAQVQQQSAATVAPAR